MLLELKHSPACATYPLRYTLRDRLTNYASATVAAQAQDYRIQYDSILRLFVLPKSHSPHTLVVISLDPPVRKGQTYYAHILTQFPSDDQASIMLEIDDEALAAKNAAVRLLCLLVVHPCQRAKGPC